MGIAGPPLPPPPPPPAPPAPPARSGPQVDIAALLRSRTPTDALIAGGLLLLLVLSFIGGWLQITFTCQVGLYCAGSSSSSAGSLWEGFGLLPALVLLGAIGWFVILKVPELGLGGIVPDSPRWRTPWMGVAAVEVVLFLLYWPIEGGTYAYRGAITPGWALWASIAFAAVVGIGGYLEYRKVGGKHVDEPTSPGAGTLLNRGSPPGHVSPWPGGGTHPATGGGQLPAAPPGEIPPAPAPPVLAVGTLSPDRSEWFDGTAWQDASLSAPPGALRSPDGNHWWDGATWRAIPGWRVRAQGTEMLRPVPRVAFPAVAADPAVAAGPGGERALPGAGGEVEEGRGGPEQPDLGGASPQPPADAPDSGPAPAEPPTT